MHPPPPERSSRVRCAACCRLREASTAALLGRFRASSPPRSSKAPATGKKKQRPRRAASRFPRCWCLWRRRRPVSGRAPADELSDHPPAHTFSQCVVLNLRLVCARRAREPRGVGRRASRLAQPRENPPLSWRHSGRRRLVSDTPSAEGRRSSRVVHGMLRLRARRSAPDDPSSARRAACCDVVVQSHASAFCFSDDSGL